MCSHCGAKLYNFACHGCNHPLIKVSLNASRLHAGYIKKTITIHQASLWARVLHERRAESCGAQIASSKRAWPPLAPWTQVYLTKMMTGASWPKINSSSPFGPPATAPKSCWKISFFPLRMRVCPVAAVQCHGNHWNLGGTKEQIHGVVSQRDFLCFFVIAWWLPCLHSWLQHIPMVLWLCTIIVIIIIKHTK